MKALLEEVAALLKKNQQTVATAESVTGGLIAKLLSDLPGSSSYLRGGVVCYQDEVKSRILGISPALFTAKTAVSPEVAEAMASAVRRLFQADVGVASTGVAGPEPLAGKPVGEIHVAVAAEGKGEGASQQLSLSGDRAGIRQQAAKLALMLLREQLILWKASTT